MGINGAGGRSQQSAASQHRMGADRRNQLVADGGQGISGSRITGQHGVADRMRHPVGAGDAQRQGGADAEGTTEAEDIHLGLGGILQPDLILGEINNAGRAAVETNGVEKIQLMLMASAIAIIEIQWLGFSQNQAIHPGLTGGQKGGDLIGS